MHILEEIRHFPLQKPTTPATSASIRRNLERPPPGTEGSPVSGRMSFAARRRGNCQRRRTPYRHVLRADPSPSTDRPRRGLPFRSRTDRSRLLMMAEHEVPGDDGINSQGRCSENEGNDVIPIEVHRWREGQLSVEVAWWLTCDTNDTAPQIAGRRVFPARVSRHPRAGAHAQRTRRGVLASGCRSPASFAFTPRG